MSPYEKILVLILAVILIIAVAIIRMANSASKKCGRLHCLFGHEWTCNSEEGIPPTEMQKQGGMDGFAEYAQMYCKRCGKQSELNERLK